MAHFPPFSRESRPPKSRLPESTSEYQTACRGRHQRRDPDVIISLPSEYRTKIDGRDGPAQEENAASVMRCGEANLAFRVNAGSSITYEDLVNMFIVVYARESSCINETIQADINVARELRVENSPVSSATRGERKRM